MSVSFAAVSLARKIFGDLKGRTVLVVGAGEMGKLTAIHMKSQGVHQVTIVSRTMGHAARTAEAIGGASAAPWEELDTLIGSADIGELMMRAFILRRAVLLEGDGVGSVILGEAGSPDTVRLRGLLTRNGYPHSLIDADGVEGKTLVERLGMQADDLPILICPNGAVLKRPSDAQAGVGLGITPVLEPGSEFDVIVVGAGPVPASLRLSMPRPRVFRS